MKIFSQLKRVVRFDTPKAVNVEAIRPGFQCSCCGMWHEGFPLAWDVEAPDFWDSSKDDASSFLDEYFCNLGGNSFFVHGFIDIPILNTEDIFRWGVWVSLSQVNFDRAMKLWKRPEIVEEPEYFGWMSNCISIYPETVNLKTNVIWKQSNQKPLIQMEPTDHPLAVEQRTGITIDRVTEIASILSHATSQKG